MLPDGIKPCPSPSPSAIRGCVSVATSGALGADHDGMKENEDQADIPGSNEEKDPVFWQGDPSFLNKHCRMCIVCD